MDDRHFKLAVAVLIVGVIAIVLAAITGVEIHAGFWTLLGGFSTYALGSSGDGDTGAG